jgi:hypothetical protein
LEPLGLFHLDLIPSQRLRWRAIPNPAGKASTATSEGRRQAAGLLETVMILITGASGRIAGRTAELLAGKRVPLRLMSRTSENVPKIAGVQPFTSDFRQTRTLDPARTAHFATLPERLGRLRLQGAGGA